MSELTLRGYNPFVLKDGFGSTDESADALGSVAPSRCTPSALGWKGLVLGTAVTFGACAVIVYPSTQRTHCVGPLTACKSNLKNMATALEMYAQDHGGLYPLRLADLTSGHYLRSVPSCPEAHRPLYAYERYHTPQGWSFRMHCCGSWHARAYTAFAASPHNFPQYDAERGLNDHP